MVLGMSGKPLQHLSQSNAKAEWRVEQKSE